MLLEGLARQHEIGVGGRLPERDSAAFAALYERHYPRLLRFCRRRVRDAFTAEELAQDAFMRAFAAFDRLDTEEHFYPWLTVIAKRLIIDYYRRDGRTIATAEVDPGAVEGAEAALLQEAENQQVWEALNRVGVRHQEVLRLRDVEQLSYEAIAKRMGTTLTTVPPLLHRARAALRREYLALTEGERSLAVPPTLMGMGLALRRIRNRLMQGVASRPDASALATPVAAVTLTLVGWMIPMNAAVIARDAVSESVSSGLALPHSAAAGSAGASRHAYPRREMSPPNGPTTGIGTGRLLLATDQSRSREVRERAQRMPIFVELGGYHIGADPEAGRQIAESTMAGDLDWTR